MHLKLLLLTLFTYTLTHAQVAPDKYWVRFTDKNNSPYSINNPETFLSQKAIDRRLNHGIAITENDLPVNPTYLSGVENTGAVLLNASKWFNSVTVYTTNPSVITAISTLPYVLSVESVNGGGISVENTKPFFAKESLDKLTDDSWLKGNTSGQAYNYGQAFNQIDMLNGIALHDLGYDGEGMTIAVLDAGFLNVDVLSAFDSLWINNKIKGWKDFADPMNPDIFGSHSHGCGVLSTMGANLPGQMVGTAPQADYWLLRSEDAGSEYLIEELNWVSAAEFADSVGADVINSSLSYTTFDDPAQDHGYSDLDGNTTIITKGADMAVSKGMIIVNSAGNYGGSSWQYVGAPADGDSVFSIGAVDPSGNYASFSSIGPTYDGRIRPNVVAQGSGSTVISAWSGNVVSGSGTSYSSPITTGMVACLWQAHPDKRNTDIMDALQQNASQSNNPDMLLGYGIPDYFQAHTLLSLPVIHEINLEIKVFLEGPFNGNVMNTNLSSILPLAQPYDAAPFNYPGNEQVNILPAGNIVDWVLVELRDAPSVSLANNSSVIAQSACFLLNDGAIVDTSGVNQVSFNLAITDSLYLAIYHRNHLAVISSTAITQIGNSYSYNFTISGDKAYGGALGYKYLSNGFYGLATGDANGDGLINSLDKNEKWNNTAGSSQYTAADLNLDTQVNNIDKDDFWDHNTSFISQVPQ